jgi:hypothetical protein
MKQIHELTPKQALALRRRANLKRLGEGIREGLVLRENHAKWRAEILAGKNFTNRWCDDTPATRRFIEDQRISKRRVYGALAELSLRNPQQVFAADGEVRRLVRDLRRQLTAGIASPNRETRQTPRPREHSVRAVSSRGPPSEDG